MQHYAKIYKNDGWWQKLYSLVSMQNPHVNPVGFGRQYTLAENSEL